MRVVSEFPNATLLIAGAPAFNQEHEYAELLKRAASELGISNRVLMLGARDDVPAVMQALDLLVVNSSSEACCLVVLEAMASRRPGPGNAHRRDSRADRTWRDGWLVPLRDEDHLVTAIRKLIGQSELRAQLAEQARQCITSRFGMDQYMRAIQSFYRESDVVDVYSLSRRPAANAVTSQSNRIAALWALSKSTSSLWSWPAVTINSRLATAQRNHS